MLKRIDTSKLGFIIKNNKKIVFKFLNYYLFTILSMIISLWVISYLTHKLPESGYGYLGLFTSISFFIPSLVSFNAVGLIQINIVNYSHDRYVNFRNNFISFCFFLFSILEIILLLFFKILGEYNLVAQFSLLYGFILILSTIHNSELIQKGNATQFGLLNFFTSVLSVIITIVLISTFNFDWEGRVLGFIFSELVFVLIRFGVFSSIWKEFKISFNIIEWKYFVKFGATLWLGFIAGWIINQSDRFVLLHFLTIKDVGVYSAGASISGFLVAINGTMVKVFAPTVYRILKEKRNKSHIIHLFRIYSILILCIALAICIFTVYFLPCFFGEKYLTSKWIICTLTLAQAFFGMYQVVGLVLEYLKLNNLKSLIVTISAIVCLSLSITLIPVLGINAPAIGILISFIVLASLTYFYAKRHLIN